MSLRASELESATLRERLRERIRCEGAISFRDWMNAALYDARDGYYSRRDLERWGRTGDYRTSSERSPLFAATFADYFAKLFLELNAPPEFTILEAGAGAGHFARGVLETLAQEHTEIFARVRYVIDERSAGSRKRIERILSDYAERVEFHSLARIKKAFTGIIFSNELLDALPVHSVIMRDGKLRELRVDVGRGGEFAWVESKLSVPELASYFDWCDVELAEGQIVEVNLDALDWVTRAASSLNQGFIISIDYGAEAEELYGAPHRREGTLRAFRRHRFAESVLANPGEQDLTSTVNWTAMMKAGERVGLMTLKLQRQDQFLLEAGLLDRLEKMASEKLSEAEALQLRTSARDLIMPDRMGASFQVLIQKKMSA
ncbi:MAG TPA: SAM-dependent methyltransferase [Pyrinomonadaceae bacterium]|nr:SAM-dependent methyltransferase [Pyrinomonadaceae bacterium]